MNSDLRKVIDNLSCEEIESDEQRYLQTVCDRLDRIGKKRLGIAAEELKPKIEIFGRLEEKKEEIEEFEILEIPEVEGMPKAEKKEIEIPTEFEEISEELPEWKAVEEPFRKDDYVLHTKEVNFRGGRKQRIYFFAKEEGKSGTPCQLPEGYEVKINERGLPYIKKK
jgi:hypothetical protein